MRISAKQLSDIEQMETLDALYTAAGAVRGRKEMKLFLRDLLTEGERVMLGRRILIARKLLSGDGYVAIAAELGVGHDTIFRVKRWLDDQLPGYENAIAGMEAEFGKRFDRELYETSMLYRLKKKYPGHFLFFPTPKSKKKQ